MANPSNLKATLFDLADRDRAAIARIRERLELKSNALAVRLAIRDLARRLDTCRPQESSPAVSNPSVSEGQPKSEAAPIGPAQQPESNQDAQP